MVTKKPKGSVQPSSDGVQPGQKPVAGDGAQQNEESRRLKKRELDRRCQRMARDRTKAHIANLEKLVEEFRSQDSTGRISTLMQQLDAVKKERDELAKTLGNIAKLTQPHQSQDTVKVENTADDDESSNLQLARTPLAPRTSFDRTSRSPFAYPASPSTSPDDTTFQTSNSSGLGPESFSATTIPSSQPQDNFMDLEYAQDAVPQFWQSSMADPPFSVNQHNIQYWDHSGNPLKEPCECLDPSPNWTLQNRPRNLWRFANDVLVAATSPAMKDQLNRITPDLDEEVPIRAVLEGWDAVADLIGNNPAWIALRQIDEQIFAACSQVERLAVLVTMYGLLRAHSEPGDDHLKQLPTWYKTKPATSDSTEPYAVNYFTWPGLRQRFAIAPHRYCLNDFWKLFVSNFRIQWPYELRDCYSINKYTKSYQVAPHFSSRLRDLRTWTLGPDFFKRFPELCSAIPINNSVPDQIWQPPVRQTMLIQQQQQPRQTQRPAMQNGDNDTTITTTNNNNNNGHNNININNKNKDNKDITHVTTMPIMQTAGIQPNGMFMGMGMGGAGITTTTGAHAGGYNDMFIQELGFEMGNTIPGVYNNLY